MCRWLTMQLPPQSSYQLSAGCNGPHSHTSYDELSTVSSLSCPSIINIIFNTFLPVAFGSVKSQLQGAIGLVVINRTWYLVFEFFLAKTSEGLEVSP